MKTTFFLASAVIVLIATGVWAGDLPSEFSYTILKEGKQIGTSTTQVESADGVYVFSTVTQVDFGENSIDLTTRTELDRNNFTARRFSYEGLRGGKVVEGEFVVDGPNVEGWTSEEGVKSPYSRVSTVPRVLLLEDYVMSHEVMIANAFMAGESDPADFGLLMPTSGAVMSVQITKGSVSALESMTQEAICTKLVIAIQGSSPFASYFDPESGLPVYLAFPTALVEVFLDDFYGDVPISRYREKE